MGPALLAATLLSAPGVTHAQAPITSKASDAIVMIYPQDTWSQVVITFSRETPRATALSLIQRMSKAGGWKLSNISGDNASVAGQHQKSKQQAQADKKYTQISGMISGPPIYSGGGFRLQPYLDALAGLDRFEVMFLTSPVNGFQGLFAYADPQLQVDLLRDGNPYHYRVTVKDRSKPLPKLPSTQQRYIAGVQPGQSPPTAGVQSGKSGADLMTGLMLAAAAGLCCMLALMWRQAARSMASDGNVASQDKTLGRKEIHRV
jgi:hypothetical protein